MKKFFIGFFAVILLSMMAMTSWASMERSVFQAGRGLWPDPWFLATLLDACLVFLVFYVWVACKERTTLSRILWFLLIMALGNMAAAFYVLLQLRKLRTLDPWKKLLLREES
jgi:uncharacterized membrane protein